MWYCQGILRCLDLVHTTRLFGSLQSCRQTQKTATRSLMRDSKDSKALGKSVVCKQSHCDLQSVDLLEETSLQDKEVYIINVFQIYSSLGASYDKTSQGRKYLLYFIFP